MTIGDFRSPNLEYKGWLEAVSEGDQVRITSPADKEVFITEPGKSKKEITVSGEVKGGGREKVMVVIRTDRDYPQALGEAKEDGTWSFSGCTLGGSGSSDLCRFGG